jgi:cytochrome P450
MYRIALSSVGRALFAAEFDDRFLDALDRIMREVSAIQRAAMFGFPLTRRPDSNREYRDAMRVVEEAIRAVAARRHGPCPNAPLWEVLSSYDRGGGGRPSPPTLVRDEILTMITAGHETTAAALCWALHAIAADPEVRERFYREVDDVTGGRPVTAADLPRLVYTRMVIDETLRLYPPVWIVARTAACDVELGGHPIPAGSGVLVSPYALHRHPEFWPEPGRFAPERFAPEAGLPAPFTYFPFYAGRHLCLGKHFALAEMVVVLATIAQRYCLLAADDRPVAAEPLVSLRVRGGLFLDMEPRIDRSPPR